MFGKIVILVAECDLVSVVPWFLLPFLVLRRLVTICGLVGNFSGVRKKCGLWGFQVKYVPRY